MGNDYANWESEERQLFLQQIVPKSPLQPVILEKDFWVVWILKRLFSIKEISPYLIFKGGTSLSKGFKLIERFSEDVDISIDRPYLGFEGSEDEFSALSKTARAKKLDELKATSIRRIKENLFPLLQASLSTADLKGDWKLEIDSEDPQSILFHFPEGLKREAFGYIAPVIKIELGARADPWPLTEVQVQSYISEISPEVIEEDATQKIKVLAVERTFWEKATILHAEYHRPSSKIQPKRHSRHFYDLFVISKTEYGQKALHDLDLLKRVVSHKEIFFHSSWANYASAKPGSFRLVPKQDQIEALEADYSGMKEMFFDKPPNFADVLFALEEIERMINSERA